MTTNDGGIIGTTKVVDHGLAAVRWNIVVMGDGYQKSSIPQYQMNVQNFVNTLQSTPPFTNLWQSMNIYRVDVWSVDSGADDPATCADGNGGSGVTPKTFFDASFCNDGIRRALMVNNTTAITVANQQVPAWDMIIVLVNSTIYGGTGGKVAVSSLEGDFSQIIIHEMGHTLFNFADEYEYLQGCGSGETDHNKYTGLFEPNRPNVTKNSNRNTIKWRDLILPTTPVPTTKNTDCTQCDPQLSPFPDGTVGAFEGGLHYHCGIFRGEMDCKMRNVDKPFCAVCSSTIEKKLSERLGGIIRFSGIAAIAAHYGSNADQIQHVIVGTNDGKAREVYWVRSQEEEAGTDVLKQFGSNSIGGVAGYYSNGDQNYHVIVGTSEGKVWELYWQGANAPGYGVLKSYSANVVAVAGHYVDIDQLHHVIVGTKDGILRELYWQGSNPPREDVLKQFGPDSIVSVAAYHSSNDQYYHVIVGTSDGRVWELYWQGANAPGYGVLKQFGANNVTGVAGFYGGLDQNHHVIVGTRDGKVYELYWQGPIEAITREIAAFPGLGIIGVAAYFNPTDQQVHVIVATTDGIVREIRINQPSPISLTVPNVIGLDTETARQAIVNAGLIPIFIGPTTNAKVVDQSPPGGTSVPIWSNVNLTSTAGVVLEDFYEWGPNQARQWLQARGLIANFTGSGTWIDLQSPGPGAIVLPGSQVTLHLNAHTPP